MFDLERIASFFPAAWRRRVAACAGQVHEVDGLAVCLTGVPVDAFNPTLVERMPTDPEAALASAERLYADTAVRFGIDLDEELHAPLRGVARRAGLRLEDKRPAMAAKIADVERVPAPEGVEIVRVDDTAMLDQIALVDAASFETDAAMVRRFLPDEVLTDPAQRVYAARADGRIVGAGESACVDGVLGVFGVATDPAYRRRGIGAAVTSFLVGDRAGDADLAVLDASELGFGVYERLGFRVTSNWEVWVKD